MKCGDPNNPGGPYIRPNGQPCKRDVREGMTRCNLHGGNNLASKVRAEQMMAQARLPAIEVLYSIIDQYDSDPCPTCGYPHKDAEEKRVVISAARTVLDRAGMGPSSTLTIATQSDGDLDLSLLSSRERAQLGAALDAVRAIKADLRNRMSAVVVQPVSNLTRPPEERKRFPIDTTSDKS